MDPEVHVIIISSYNPPPGTEYRVPSVLAQTKNLKI